MDSEPDRKEIDLLIRELTSPARPPRPPAPALKQQTTTEPPGPSAPAAAPFAEIAAEPAKRPGTRWTNVRLLMPSPRAIPAFGPEAEVASMPRLPSLSSLTRFFSMPEPATMARMWVGLGAAYSASMTFWPYPKTYLWGMVLYLLCLGLALVTSIWGARLSWDTRLGAAHTVALGTALWAVTLVTVEALPLV